MLANRECVAIQKKISWGIFTKGSLESLICPNTCTISFAYTTGSQKSGKYYGLHETLLYSKYKIMKMVKKIGESWPNDTVNCIYYNDFRKGAEVRISKEMFGRQPYGAVFYSERKY